MQYVSPPVQYVPPPVYDVCPTLPGGQTTVPAGLYLVNGWCTYNVGQSYISLTQIPYTGFDFGAWGNAI